MNDTTTTAEQSNKVWTPPTLTYSIIDARANETTRPVSAGEFHSAINDVRVQLAQQRVTGGRIFWPVLGAMLAWSIITAIAWYIFAAMILAGLAAGVNKLAHPNLLLP